MFNYGIAPGGGFTYQTPVNGYQSNQGQYYNQSQKIILSTTTGWVQPQFSNVQPTGFTNYHPQNMSYGQPVQTGWIPLQNSGWHSTSQPIYQQPQIQTYNPNHGYSHGYGMPFIGGGCGNCGTSAPMIRRDW